MNFKNIANSISKYLKIKYEDAYEKYEAQKEAQATQNLCMYNNQMHIDLQYVLSEILAQRNISPLLGTVHIPQDLILSGFQIYTGQPTTYYFALIKTSQNRIPAYLLNQLTNRFNQIIRMERTNFIAYANSLDPVSRTSYFMENRLMYNGFHVIDCKDNLDAVILAVSID